MDNIVVSTGEVEMQLLVNLLLFELQKLQCTITRLHCNVQATEI